MLTTYEYSMYTMHMLNKDKNQPYPSMSVSKSLSLSGSVFRMKNCLKSLFLQVCTVAPALIVIDMQNGFVAKGGSYDKIGMNTSLYREIIPKLKEMIEFCRSMGIPVFYTEAVKEKSGIDILTNVHNILPKSRQERLKVPICIKGTWDGVTIDELKPKERDPVVLKRRDSAFLDTEFRIMLQSQGINFLVFTGIDTSICVETSLREGFNIGYDVAIISDATASGDKRHYETTLERVRDYYGLVMDTERFKRAIGKLDMVT